MALVRVLVLGVVVALISAASADDKAKLDPAKLVGTYMFESGVKDGEKVPADHFKGMSVTITKDGMVMKTPDGDFKFKYSVDATKTPAAIDLEILDGPVGKGSKSKGIVALDGTTLKLAYSPTDGERPKDFDAKKGSGNHSFTLKKAEKK
ncbi:MAG TPA: TIGR03067 domain-containing protein [Gemmataceae bacterium]|nr:TIGR03067 domain-containing protein [Gemmataceae bacterium]